MGFVLHMRILASRPPVAMREPSGWTWQEKMERRLGLGWSLVEESVGGWGGGCWCVSK